MVELYQECTDLNFQPFNYTEKNEYSLGDIADPDINFYNRLQVDSHYYTDEQFNRKLSCRKQGSEYFSLIHYNCRSIVKNFNMLKDHVTTLEVMFDVIALSETWLNDNSSDTVNLDGYDFVSCPRSSKRGGGVGLYIKNSLQHKYLPLLSKSIDNCAEIVTAEVKLRNGKTIIVCCIYRAPNTDMTLLNEHINLIFSKNSTKTVYLCGDFNVDLLQYDKHADTNHFVDQLFSFGLHPLITRPTRITRDTKTSTCLQICITQIVQSVTVHMIQ